MRPPDPAEIVRVGPVAVSRQLFRAPRVFVVILTIVTEPLREEALAIAYPIVNLIKRGGEKLPIAGVVARDDQLSRAAVTQRKPRRVGIDPCAPAVAHGQAHATIARHVDPVESRFLGGHRGARRVNFKILFAAIKLDEANDNRAFEHAQRDAIVTQCDDPERRTGREPHEVSRVDLDFHSAVFVGGDGVALDERIVQPGAFPVVVAVALEIHFPGYQTDAHDPGFYVVIVGLVVVIVSGLRGSAD
jgi:hypothetical protein